MKRTAQALLSAQAAAASPLVQVAALAADAEARQRLVDRVVQRANAELSIPERRAFARVVRRALELRAAGRRCPVLPAPRDVEPAGDVVRLRGRSATLASAPEWPLYLRARALVLVLWNEAGGPPLAEP
jgi:hypothetical protein